MPAERLASSTVHPAGATTLRPSGYETRIIARRRNTYSRPARAAKVTASRPQTVFESASRTRTSVAR